MPRLFLKSGRRVLLGIAVWRAVVASAGEPKPEEIQFFENKIRPLLAEYCYPCHSASAEKLKGGLRLDTKDGTLRGGESGNPAILPGDAEGSLLIQAIRYQNNDLQMPPPKQGRLTDQKVAAFVAWVNLGAPDPRVAPVSSSEVRVPSSKHWAFQPPKDHPIPSVKNSAWPKTAVDHFILARLEEKELEPAPPADKRTLIRRATCDLIGLPPTPAEVEAFLRDDSPLAFARVVDRLL